MNIEINLLETASALANEIVCAKFEDDDDLMYIYEITGDISRYTEEAQDVFNEWYDYYYTLLENLKQ